MPPLRKVKRGRKSLFDYALCRRTALCRTVVRDCGLQERSTVCSDCAVL